MAASPSALEDAKPPAQDSHEEIYIPAKINGLPAWLALDTGSPMLLLWDNRAARFDLKESALGKTVHLTIWGRVADVDGLIQSTQPDDDLMNEDGILPLSYFHKDVVQIDAASHEARLLKEVPAETQSWNKYPLRKDLPDLAFGVPLADGKQALVYVDTGNPFGIFIPAKQWPAWHDENRQAPVTLVAFSQLTTGSAAVEKEAWASHFTLGSLQLADVPITAMPEGIARPGPMLELAAMLLFQTNIYALMPAGEATLGMRALKQLDVIVDGPGGFIYIKAKETAPAPYDHNRLGVVFVTNDLLNSSPDEPLRAKVAPGSPAAEAGIQDGDILMELDGYQGSYTGADATEDINRTFYEPAGTKVGLKVKRGDQTLSITATLRNLLGPDKSTSHSYVVRSRVEIGRKDYDAAITDDNQALELDSRNADAYESRGNAEMGKKDYDAAIADYTKALELDPNDATLQDHRGWVKWHKHDYAGAIADETKAIDLDPEDASFYDDRGAARRHEGDFDGAIADETKAIKVDPKYSSAYEDRGYAENSKGEHDAAIADETKAIELNPKDVSAYEFRGIVKQTQGDFAGALAEYNQAIKIKPDDTRYAHLYRQFLLLWAGTAPGDFAATVAQWPDSWPKPRGLFVAGELGEAGLLAAAEKEGTEPVDEQKCEADYDIGMMRLLKGDQAGARDFFQKSMASGSKVYDEYNLAQAELARLDASRK